MAVESKAKQSKFLGIGPQLICDLKLSTLIGKNEAVLLQQVYYWLQESSVGQDLFKNGKKWIYKTYKEWTKQLGWSLSTVRRTIKNLEELKILISCKPDKTVGYHRKSYTINFDVLKEYSDFKNLTLEHIGSVQNEHIIYKDSESTVITSISSSENVDNKQVGSLAKPPRKAKTNKPEIKENKLTEANKIIYQLVEIYNKHVGEGKVILNKKLARWIMAAFQKLGSCFKKWENFCKRIATSDWLMGRITNGFKASLTWLLKFDIMDRILGGDFKCKEPYEEAPIPTENDEQQLIQEIEVSEDTVEEQSIKKTLLKTFGVNRFKSYFAQVKVKLEQGKVILLVESMFHRDQIDTPTMWDKIMALYPKVALEILS